MRANGMTLEQKILRSKRTQKSKKRLKEGKQSVRLVLDRNIIASFGSVSEAERILSATINGEKVETIPNPPSGKRKILIHADGSCTETWPDGLTLNYSPEQWTTFCKLMSVGIFPIVTQVESPGKKPKLEVTVPSVSFPGPAEDRWLELCKNDPNRDAVQILFKEKTSPA